MNILLPKGDDAASCREAYQNQTGIEAPTFSDRRLRIFSSGAVFWLMKGADIPGLISQGYGDIGVAGSDAMLKYELQTKRQLRRRKIGPEMCRFSLLAYDLEATAMSDTLSQSPVAKTLRAVTSEPEILSYICAGGDLPLLDAGIQLNGSVEAALLLSGVDVAADVVQTGNTSRAMGLTEIRSLMSIYPELVEKSSL